MVPGRASGACYRPMLAESYLLGELPRGPLSLIFRSRARIWSIVGVDTAIFLFNTREKPMNIVLRISAGRPAGCPPAGIRPSYPRETNENRPLDLGRAPWVWIHPRGLLQPYQNLINTLLNTY